MSFVTTFSLTCQGILEGENIWAPFRDSVIPTQKDFFTCIQEILNTLIEKNPTHFSYANTF